MFGHHFGRVELAAFLGAISQLGRTDLQPAELIDSLGTVSRGKDFVCIGVELIDTQFLRQLFF